MDQKPTLQNQSNALEEESRQTREATQRLKKKILIVFAGMIVFAIIALLLIAWIDGMEQDKNNSDEEETKNPPTTIIYYDPDYEYDIMQDEEYLGLDRYIYYKNSRTNETIIIEDKAIQNNNYGPAVQVLKKMIDAIIAGDHEAYNALFSDNYFAVPGRAPEEPFTMQQVYGIKFTVMNEFDTSDEQFGRYTQYEFIVEYKIHKNNGTFVVGLDHDTTRRQYFVLSDSVTDQVLIDQVSEYGYSK